MQFTILHQTTYRYPQKIHESYTICHLQPRSDQTQYCTKFELAIVPRVRLFAYQDRFGNDVHHFAYLPDHNVLSITARSNVATTSPALPEVPERVERAQLEADPALPLLYDFLHESPYVAFSSNLRDLAAGLGPPEDDLVAYYLRAGDAINRDFSYDKSATSVHATIDESIRLRGGVCQDFAHILVGLCRLAGIPARYVSGYIFSGQEGSILGADASHAWCEAYLPPHGWVGFDPTNAKLINDEFVKIAIGRDYRDVSPVRGVYKGASSATMSVNVGMEALANQ